MTNDDVLFLSENLPLVDAPGMHQDFNYAVSHNLRESEKIAIDINKAIEPKPKLRIFNKSMQDLREKHADKDDNDEAKFTIQPIGNNMANKLYEIPGLNDPDSPFNKEVETLKEEYKTVLTEREKQLKYLNKENNEYKPLMIDYKLLPKGLSRRAMDAVFLITTKPEK